MTNHEIKIAFEEYSTLAELSKADQNICNEAVRAMANSHSPYSKFRVGAALQLQSGRVVLGSNQENVAYPSGLCAERVALFNWGANHPDDPIQTIAITAHTDNFDIIKPVTPCGSCLQVMAEYEKKQDQQLRIILYCIDGPVWITQGVCSFLPFMFFEDRLVIQ
ncbi:cytidine deaminase [Mucilaginibacter mali]|uniref:Cytidine deaminase n=1 Tax=Mucilaginibacter mali TaxID=2740462 RepID=A0A7D4Q4J5_9SPHI|nr:cytidine deaminase [Mucilaginibacter mali]QKJ31007.1 cytidine deaminase [Mucilaginibacter mali]